MLHDIGKGRVTDHSLVGRELIQQIGARLEASPLDVEMLATLIHYHLLFPIAATRGDLNDPRTY
nr:HD domain-containing protein [Mycobacterium leprae]